MARKVAVVLLVFANVLFSARSDAETSASMEWSLLRESAGALEALEAEPEPVVLRRAGGRDLTTAAVRQARRIINQSYRKPFGTEVAFEADGKQFVCRIERHYHPPGGDKLPWGHHPGCSLFVRER